MKLDPVNTRSNGHTNRFIKAVYEASYGDTTYGEAWLAELKTAEESAKGVGPIESEEEFFQQRAAQFKNFLRTKGSTDENKAPVQKYKIDRAFARGLPLMYVYHVNEFRAGGVRFKEFKTVNPAILEDLPNVAIDVAGARAAGKTELDYEPADDMFSVAYSPKTKTLYVSADNRANAEVPRREFKILNVPYVNGRFMVGDTEDSEEATAAAATEDLTETKAKWDAAQAEATRLQSNLKDSIMRALGGPGNPPRGESAFDEMDDSIANDGYIMDGLKEVDTLITTYHTNLQKQYEIRKAAEADLPDDMNPSTDANKSSSTTPWGSAFPGMFSGYYPFKDVMRDYVVKNDLDALGISANRLKLVGDRVKDSQRILDWWDNELNGSDYRWLRTRLQGNKSWHQQWVDM